MNINLNTGKLISNYGTENEKVIGEATIIPIPKKIFECFCTICGITFECDCSYSDVCNDCFTKHR